MTWTDRLRWTALAKSKAPILIGPWISEVGFEVLYFLPWLLGLRKKYGLAKDRLTVITRGGAGVWYDAFHSVELYDYVTLETLRKRAISAHQQTGSVKQQRMTEWEAKLLPVIAHDLGIRRYHVIHPSEMYNGLAPFWKVPLGSALAIHGLEFGAPPVGSTPLNLPLPERFVAVRFYARPTFPLTEDSKIWVANLVDTIAKQIPVVLLESGIAADDHLDFPISGPNILSLKDYVTPQNNLAIQSAVIAKSQGFVGTYGGTQQLSVRLKKPTVGFFEEFKGTAYAHKQLTEWLAVQQGTPCFIGRLKDAHWVKEVLQG